MAGDFTKRTIVTVNEPLVVPGKQLTPGTYVMKLRESPSNRHIVEIYNADESELQATVHAIPNRRIEPKGQTEFVFWETPVGQPKALRAWFYPGDHIGQEFQYPADELQRLAQRPASTVTVASIQTGQIEPPQQVAQAQPPPPPPAQPQPEVQPEPQPAPLPAQPEPAPAPPPARLPRTASPFPLIGLAGLLSLGSAALLHAVTRRSS